jgi:hypothetical protein
VGGRLNVTIHLYRAQQPARPFSAMDKRTVAQSTIITEIVRHAVIKEEMLEPEEVNIEIDAHGDVLVEEQKPLIKVPYDSAKEKRTIRVPHQEAYQRIVQATQKRINLLERLYQQSTIEAQHWFQRSFIFAAIETIVLTLSVMIPLFLVAQHLETLFIPATMLIVALNTFNAILTAWVFLQSHRANKYVDLYLANLTEIRSFSTVAQFITSLEVDHDCKHLLQKTLLSRSLGLSI